MSDAAISPLRRRMIEDMTVRNFSADTQLNYVRGVKSLANRRLSATAARSAIAGTTSAPHRARAGAGGGGM